jgi:hypothetical protein
MGMKSHWQDLNSLPRLLVAGMNICILAMEPEEGYDWVRLDQWPHFLSFPGKVQKRLKKLSVQNPTLSFLETHGGIGVYQLHVSESAF